MIRKILASVLCLMLALALPLGALAATDVTVRLIPGDELTQQEPTVGTALNSLFVHVVGADEGATVALESDKGEIVSAALTGNENGIYVSSPLLGDRTLYFTMEDLQNFMVETMKQQGAGEEEIAQIQQMFAQMGAQPAAMALESQDMEAMMNDPALMQLITGLADKIVVTEGEFTDAAHDPATTQTVVTLTGEDLALVFDMQMVKDMYANLAKTSGMEPEAMLKMIKDMIAQLDVKYVITVLTNEDDLCAMQMDMTIVGDATIEVPGENGTTTTETFSADMTMDLDVNALTKAEDVVNVNITCNMANKGDAEGDLEKASIVADIVADDNADTVTFVGSMTVEGSENEKVDFQGAFAEGEDDSLNGWIAILADNNQMTFQIQAKEEAGVTNVLVSLLVRENATAIVEPTWSDKPLFSVAVQVKEVETPAALTALASATPETSLQLLKMTEAELESELEAISGDAMSALMAGLSNLPAELLSLMME